MAKLIDWEAIERVAYEAMGTRHRRPPLRPRLVAGLLYLQHTFDLSDEEVMWAVKAKFRCPVLSKVEMSAF